MKDDMSLQAAKLICGLGALALLLPIWLTLFGWMLSATDAPSWVWGLYWCYMPLSFIAGVARAFVDACE